MISEVIAAGLGIAVGWTLAQIQREIDRRRIHELGKQVLDLVERLDRRLDKPK